MELVFASNNPNKIQEIQLLLPQTLKILSLHDIGCFEDIAETANTIEGNAILKANYITQKYGYNCFADDSGLEVDYLNGQPGVHSARFAGEQRNDDDNINKLLQQLDQQQNRKANFKTVICLNLNGNQTLFTGIIDGSISTEKKGNQGFGYDPIFKPNGYPITFAEMDKLHKTQISHRGIATKQLINFLELV
jgi:XTP/dITP diphosphohydrolase